MARFYRGYPWRFLVTDLDGVAVTGLDRLAMNPQMLFKLNAPAEVRSGVPSDDPRVNLDGPEGDPSVNFGDRLIYGFRREAPDVGEPWVCRFGGVMTQIEDSAPGEQPYSSFTAHDPWQLLFHRKLWDGTTDPPATGYAFTATPGNDIVATIVQNSIDMDGTVYLNFGTFDTTPDLNITFQQGTSVGAALQQLVATGSLDVVIEPFYDVADPGVVGSINVYTQAGDDNPGAVMSWDIGRSIQSPSVLYDGGQLFNDIRFHNGQGGPAVTPSEDTASQTKYGVHTLERFFPAQIDQTTVEAFSDYVLSLTKQGKRTATLTPSSLLAPIPLLDYGLGDRVPVYASDRLRQEIPWVTDTTVYQRIYGIPISLSDDGVERVDRLLASPDGF